MLIILLILLLLSNALTLQKDKSILFSRAVMVNRYRLFSRLMITVLVLVNFKFPLIAMIKLLGLKWLIPTVSSASCGLIYVFKQCLEHHRINLCVLGKTCAFGFISSSLILLALSCFQNSEIFPYFHIFFVWFLRKIIVILSDRSLVLYASSDGGSSGYAGDRSRSVSSTIEPGHGFGSLVEGLSNSQVLFIRSEIHNIILGRLGRQGSAPYIRVSDLLESSTNPDNTTRVLQKGYTLSNHKFEKDAVLAMRNIPSGNSLSVNFSSPIIKILEFKE